MKTAPRPAARLAAQGLNLAATFSCGQCFRWDEEPDGSFRGVALGFAVQARTAGGELLLEGVTQRQAEKLFAPYFDLDRDYAGICRLLGSDPVLRQAVGFAPGMRILRQDPWEALCSFIISQNNNIPRIKGIVERLCGQFGEPIGGGKFAFPTPQALCGLTADDLAPVRSGFRAGYILDAARKVASGQVDLAALPSLPLDEARALLRTIRGVGPKVAECALLFGCGRLACFPVDVWIKRVLARFYPGGFPHGLAPYGGIAQQYLFHYVRCCPESGL